MNRHSCLTCDYVYDPGEGDAGRDVAPGTPFADLPWEWVCPICGAPKDLFVKGERANGPPVRVYANDDITVIWQPELCNHNGNCTRSLPAVFDLNRRPWVDIDAADAGQIRAVIDQCPTGALSYRKRGKTGD